MNKLRLPSPAACAGAFAIVVMAWMVASPITTLDDWYHSHDGWRYPFLLAQFREAIDHGILYPRWMPHLMEDYGYPTFVFYQPGWFYFTLPFTWFLFPIESTKASLIALLVIGGAGAYLLSRLFNPRGLSVAFAGFFLFSHYVGVNIYIRGDYSELTAVLLMPWLLYFALLLPRAVRAGESPAIPVLGIAFTTAGIIYSHPFVAFFTLPAVSLLMLPESRKEGKWNGQILLTAAIAFAAGLTLSAPYWVPALQMKEEVNYRMAVSGGFGVLSHMWRFQDVFLPGLDQPRLWQTLLAAAGYYYARRNRTMQLAAALLVFSMFMVTSPSRFLWELGYPVLKFLQFPWRAYSVITLLEYLGILQLGVPLLKMHRDMPRRTAMLVFAAFALLVAVRVKPFYLYVPLRTVSEALLPSSVEWSQLHYMRSVPSSSFVRTMANKEERGWVSGTASAEFHPRTARTRWLAPRSKRGDLSPVMLDRYSFSREKPELMEGSTPFDIRFRIKADKAASVIINQLYMKGWQVEVNGKRIPWQINDLVATPTPPATGVLDNSGRMQIIFPDAGEFEAHAWYDGPPGWHIRNFLMVAILAGLACVYRRRLEIGRAFARKPLHDDPES